MHEKSHAAPASGRASKPSKSVNHRVTFEEWLVRKGYKIKAGGDEMFVLVPSTEMGSKLYPVEVIEVDYTKPADAKDLVYVRYLTTGEVGRSGTPYPAYFTGTEEPDNNETPVGGQVEVGWLRQFPQREVLTRNEALEKYNKLLRYS